MCPSVLQARWCHPCGDEDSMAKSKASVAAERDGLAPLLSRLNSAHDRYGLDSWEKTLQSEYHSLYVPCGVGVSVSTLARTRRAHKNSKLSPPTPDAMLTIHRRMAQQVSTHQASLE